MEMQPKGRHPLIEGTEQSLARYLERERRVALSYIVRRHLIIYEQVILATFAAQSRSALRVVSAEISGKEQTSNGVKASTALAKLIGLPAYQNVKKGKPEAAKHLLDFLKSAGPAHFDAIHAYFRDHVVTPQYRAEAPDFVRMAIHAVFDDPAHTDDLAGTPHHIRYSPQAIIAAIEDTTPIAKLKARLFEGCWSILRYSHQGQRVVRLALEVTCHHGARPTFKLYYRTRGMTHQNVKTTIVAHGSLIVLKGSQHAMFLGQEETHDGQTVSDGYPMILECPTRISREAPFIGLIQQRHDDGPVFAIKAQFVPAKLQSIEDLIDQNRIGSFQTPEAIAAMSSDIVGFNELMADLERMPGDLRGGLIV